MYHFGGAGFPTSTNSSRGSAPPLNATFTNVDPNALSHATGGGGPSMGITDEELLESLMMHEAPSPRQHLQYGQAAPHDNPGVALSQPLRSLPAHLGAPSPLAFNSPVSPSDIYSPASASTSNADSFFCEREGSFSGGDEVLGGQGRGSSGDTSDQGERYGSTKASLSLQAAGRRASTSNPRRERYPVTPSSNSYASLGFQHSDRPHALSVPTYLASAPPAFTTNSLWGHAAAGAGGILERGDGTGLASSMPRFTASPSFVGPGAVHALATDARFAAASSSAPTVGGVRGQDVSQGGQAPNQQDKPLGLSEKKRRRRESHNAVERRRRDNINERISELATLLPDFMLDGLTRSSASAAITEEVDDDFGNDASPSAAARPLSPQAAAAAAKPNKGVILSKSVEYIRHLQSLVELQSQRNTELEGLLRAAGERDGVGDLSSSTATIAHAPPTREQLHSALANLPLEPYEAKLEPNTPSSGDQMRD